MLSRIISIMLAVFFFTASTSAQSKWYSGYFTIGYQNLSDAGEKLQVMMPGMKKINNSFYGIGAEGSWKNKKIVLAGHAGISSHGAVSEGNSFAEPFIGYGMVKGGYVFFENKNTAIYPSIGGGITSVIVTSYEKNQNIKSNLHSVYLISPALEIGMNIDQVVYRYNNAPSTGMFIAGLRSGYWVSRKSDHWKRTGNSQNNIALASRGFYVTLALGIGYISYPNKHKH